MKCYVSLAIISLITDFTIITSINKSLIQLQCFHKKHLHSLHFSFLYTTLFCTLHSHPSNSTRLCVPNMRVCLPWSRSNDLSTNTQSYSPISLFLIPPLSSFPLFLPSFSSSQSFPSFSPHYSFLFFSSLLALLPAQVSVCFSLFPYIFIAIPFLIMICIGHKIKV